MKIKDKFFGTTKKAVTTGICALAAVAVLGTVSVFALTEAKKSSSIGTDRAESFAFADAGVDPASARVTRTEFDYDHGVFVYEIEFYVDGVEYDYSIDASTGAVVKREIDGNVQSSQVTQPVQVQITEENAREIALADAGLKESDVTFSREKLDMDDGVYVYEVDFYTSDSEYEYDINGATGAVISKSRETWKTPESTNTPASTTPSTSTNQSTQTTPSTSTNKPTQTTPSTQNTQTSTGVTLDKAKETALSDAGVKSSAATFTKAKEDYDDGVRVYDIEFYTSEAKYDYEIDATTGKVRTRESEVFAVPQTPSQSQYISVDKAKSVALDHAGLTADQVTFTKAKMDTDDGYTVYDIEFYSGRTEYEYEINATSGAVIDYDMDRD